MAASLYDISVRSYLQVLDALDGILDKAQAHCTATDIDANALLEQRITDNMLPLSFQLHMVTVASLDSLEGVRSGTISPGQGIPDLDFAGWRAKIAGTAQTLREMDAAEIDAMAGKDMTFALGESELRFDAEGFILSFSLPNLYFHATTAYAILRGEGVPLGKMDFLGQMRMAG